MKNPLLLAVFCSGIFLLVAFYFVSKALYKGRHNVTYSFRHMFPYELNYPSVFRQNFWGNLLFIFAGIFVAVFYILNPYVSIYRIVAIIISLVFMMVLICLLLMPIYYLRTHMILSVLSMTLALALPLVNLFLAFSQYKIETESAKSVLCIVSMVVSGILAGTMFLLIMNPKLTFKIYLDKEIDSSGNEVLKRPNVIFLALNEWMAIFIYFLSPLGVLLISIL